MSSQNTPQRFRFAIIVTALCLCYLLFAITVQHAPFTLRRRGSIFCWILTHAENHDPKALAVRDTWAKKCDQLLFISNTADPELPSIDVNTSDGRPHLASKSRMALDYLYQNHLPEADWFFKADDDTYVIMENLWYLLKDKDPETAVVFGNRMLHPPGEDFLDGGAGYVMSRRALELFGSRTTNSCFIDTHDGPDEDVQVTWCLRQLGVELGDTLDRHGYQRFHHFHPEIVLFGLTPEVYNKLSPLNVTKGSEAMSHFPVSFHQIQSRTMHLLEYLLYHVRIHDSLLTGIL